MSKQKVTRDEPEIATDSQAAQEFDALLAYLKQSRGFDFTAYKRSGLMRRVLVRMQTVGISRFADYQDFLQVDPEEFTRLFNTILINVTTFFRDAPAWDYLAGNVIPRILGGPESTHGIRVWSAGCASGEEAYSLAMLLADALGFDGFRDRVKIYATDVDEEALTQARQATYSTRAAQDVPPELLRKYFDRQDDRLVFNKELRRCVIFGRHDLIQDAPISRVHLLVCRNCLMYFNSEAQARILSRFHFALAEGGVLFLGKAETLLSHNDTFTPVDVRRRIFAKADRAGQADRVALDGLRGALPADPNHGRLREAAADSAPVVQVAVDSGGLVVQFNQLARSTFGLLARDLGRPLQDLEISYRPFELRSCIDRAYTVRRPVTMTDGAWTTPAGEQIILDLLVTPMTDGNNGFLGAAIFYTDVTRQRQLQDELQRSHQELETALEELQSTNEELETTNEELQSTVEELETTNEELQSTNEELETMNEELQSTNEELQTINHEALERTTQLADLNGFLEAILTSLRGGVVVVDRDLRVHKWSARAEDMWGLRSDEASQKNFLNLDIGLPVEQLRAPIRACLAGEAPYVDATLDAINRRGKPVRVKVTCSPLTSTGGEHSRGAIMVMEELDARP
jgi:two-component system, chemotaxis family, CheB/CheR fusion protein